MTQVQESQASYTVSAAAQLAGMHAQTLRQYDRLGLVSPSRAKGRGRRYSVDDIRRLREVQHLTQERGVNLAGVAQIMELERRIEGLRAEVMRLQQALAQSAAPTKRVFAADSTGAVKVRPPHLGAPRPAPQAALVSRSTPRPRRSTLVVGSSLYGWQRLAELHLARVYSGRRKKGS